MLQDRLEEGLAYWQENSEMVIVVSGGQGPDEPTTEAQCMAEFYIEAGVPEDQIFLEGKSSNTNENIRYSLEILEENGYDGADDLMIVSNGFHITRARMLFERVTGSADNLSTLAGPMTHLPSKLKMYVREPMALVKSFVFDR